MIIRSLVLLVAISAAPITNAAPVFSDNFDSNALGLNLAPTGWTTTNGGTVDIIGNPGFFDFLPGNGRYIDLDGSTSNAGQLTKTLNLIAGLTYTASFDLAGNQRANNNESVTVMFGSSNNIFSLSGFQGFTAYSLTFTPIATGNYSLSFLDDSHDNIGALLDNVTVNQVSSVPVPAAIWLFGSALTGLGLFGKRRKAALTA